MGKQGVREFDESGCGRAVTAKVLVEVKWVSRVRRSERGEG